MVKIYGSNTINELSNESAQITIYKEYTPLSAKLQNKSHDILSGNMFTSWSKDEPLIRIVPLSTERLNVTITVPDTRDEDLIRKKYPLGYMSMEISGVSSFKVLNIGNATLNNIVFEKILYKNKDSHIVLLEIPKVVIDDVISKKELIKKLNWTVKGIGKPYNELIAVIKTGYMNVIISGTISGNFIQNGKRFGIFPVLKTSNYTVNMLSGAKIPVSGYNVTYIRSKNF